MKNIALVMALVFVCLPAVGQDKEPVKKPKAEVVKKVASQPDLEALGAKLKVAVAAGKLTEKEAIAIYEKAEAGQGKSKEDAKPKAIVKPAAKPAAKPAVKPGVKPGAKPGVKPGAKPGTKPAAKPVAKPGVKPGAKPGAKPGVKPVAKAGAKSEKVDLDALLAKLKKAVDAGEITEEKAKAIYRKYEAGQIKSKEEGKPKPIAKPVGKPGAKPIAKPVKVDLAEAYEKVAREVRAAVKAGKITEEQAKQKLAAFKKQLAGKASAKEAVKKPAAAGPNLFELFRLVEKGELTAKEAMEKYKAARAKKEFPGKKSLPEKK